MRPHAQRHDTVDVDLVADVADLAARARAATGLTSFSDELWQAFRDGSANTVLTSTDQHGDLVGVAFSAPQGDRIGAELLVDPEHRGQGHGEALLTRLLDDRGGELWVWSHGDHPAAATLAGHHGLERARELYQLRRPLGPEDTEITVSPPDGVTIRTFVVGQDEHAWAAVNQAAFAGHPEQGAMTAENLRGTENEDWFDPDGFFLAEDDDGTLLGFHWTKVHPPEGAGSAVGEVYVVGVHPDAHGRGLGKALTAVGLRYLAGLPGVHTVMLYVEGDNAPALAIYRRQGFTDHVVDVGYRSPPPAAAGP